MSNLPEGDILTLDGRRCTRVPRNASNPDSNGATLGGQNPDPPLPTQSSVDVADPSAGLIMKEQDSSSAIIPTTSSAPAQAQPPAATNSEPAVGPASPTDGASSQSVIPGTVPGEFLVLSTLDNSSVVTITSTSGESQAAQPTAASEDNLAPSNGVGDGDTDEDASSSGTLNADDGQQVGASDLDNGEEEDGTESTIGPSPTSNDANGDSDEGGETNGGETTQDEEEGDGTDEDGAAGAGASPSPAASSPGGSPGAADEPVTTTLPDGEVATTFPTGNNFSGGGSDGDSENETSEDNSSGDSNGSDEDDEDGEDDEDSNNDGNDEGNDEDEDEDEDDTGISTNEEADDSSDDQSGGPVGENQDSPGGAGDGITGSEESNDSGSSIDGRQAGMIAGGVVGGVAAIALIVFLIWFCKKRHRDRKHQYVIHTPVMAGSRSGGDGSSWDNDSVRQTRRTTKFAEAFGSKVDALGRRMRAASMYGDPSAEANRRNTQFLNSPPRRDRDSRIGPEPGDLSTRDRIGDWWSRMREDANFNWRLRNGDVTEIVDYNAYNRKPNDVEVPRRSLSDVQDVRDGGQRFSRALDGQRFSGALGVMLSDARSRGNDPFSDTNEVPWNTGQANPFDDSNQVAPPSAAAGATVYNPTQPLPPRGGSTAGNARRPRGPTPADRTNAKSDQFDLEIDACRSITKPPGAHTRHDSYTSDVSSLSDDDYGGPGPDVGRAALNWADGNRASPPAEKSPPIAQGMWPLRG